MKYTFPITADIPSLLPSIGQVFSSIEGHFKDFTGESLKLSCQAPIMTFEVKTPLPLNTDQMNYPSPKGKGFLVSTQIPFDFQPNWIYFRSPSQPRGSHGYLPYRKGLTNLNLVSRCFWQH
jgi:hypothetical protein